MIVHSTFLDATRFAHDQESEGLRAALDDADERAFAARAYIAHLEALIGELQVSRAALEAQRVEMLSSTSWFLTKPLRAVTRCARRIKHVARSTIQLVPRIPALTRGGIARFRRGGWRSVQDRLAIEFQPPDIPLALKLPESVPGAIAALTLHSAVIEPLVSILIPVYGQHETTFACLQSIGQHPPHRPFEVIVMDDCSPEPAAEALAQVHGIRIIRNEMNLGFIGNVNAAAAHARGQWLIILNNDTVVRQGALDALLSSFDEHQNVGLVGAKLLNADGSLQEAGGIVWLAAPNGGASGLRRYGRHWFPLDPPRHLVFFTPDAIRRALLEAGFAEIVQPPAALLASRWTYRVSRAFAQGVARPLEATGMQPRDRADALLADIRTLFQPRTGEELVIAARKHA